jgi:hypothetical protein
MFLLSGAGSHYYVMFRNHCITKHHIGLRDKVISTQKGHRYCFATIGDKHYAPITGDCLAVLKRDLSIKERIPFEKEGELTFKDTHQIAAIDGKIFVCDTGNGRAVIYDTVKEKYEFVYFEKIPEGGREKTHLNSVSKIKGEYYFLLHNYGDSEIVVTDEQYQEKRRIKDIGKSAHNIFEFFDGSIWVLDSHNSKVNCITGEHDNIQLHGYLRGGCTTINPFPCLYVMGSASRKVSQSFLSFRK